MNAISRRLAALLILAAAAQAAPRKAAHQPAPSSSAPHINAQRVMQYTREIIAFGPRPIGSANHQKVEQYILQHVKDAPIEHDDFTASTPAGQLPVHNIVAKFPGTKDGIIVIASHYDTNYPLRNTSFIGANDGACTSALLLEFANVLRSEMKNGKRPGYSVWLFWTDAEEAIKEWSDTDSLYGTKHLAAKWQADGTLKKIKALLVADMIGDKDLDIQRDSNSTGWVEDLVYQAATQLGYQSHFFANAPDRNSQLAHQYGVQDDHLPFAKLGVPVADVIDLDYGYNNVYHHTTQDTIDKISAKSLQISGDVILGTVALLDKR